MYLRLLPILVYFFHLLFHYCRLSCRTRPTPIRDFRAIAIVGFAVWYNKLIPLPNPNYEGDM